MKIFLVWKETEAESHQQGQFCVFQKSMRSVSWQLQSIKELIETKTLFTFASKQNNLIIASEQQSPSQINPVRNTPVEDMNEFDRTNKDRALTPNHLNFP